jgi:hypothetical protein
MLSVVTKPIMLSVIMLNVVMLNVVMLNVVMLRVVAPYYYTKLICASTLFEHFTVLANHINKY